MATIKSYTDIEQSRKLAEILPLESADMCYIESNKVDFAVLISKLPHIELVNDPYHIHYNKCRERNTPCWSLAALFDVLRTFTTPTAFSVKVSAPSLIKTENGYKLTYTGDYTPMINNELDVEAPIESIADNPVDACYEMILKLYELNLL